MERKTLTDPLTFGFDIGIASVGWAVLSPTRIIDLGVRAFDKAETAKEGDSLNLVRRTARLMRRRLRRRAWRLTKLARTLKRFGLIGDLQLFQPQHPFSHSLWRLRKEGLDRLLSAEEWARVIYHICKHRGFHWISRAEEKQAESDSKGDGGTVTKALKKTNELKAKYRTAAEMVLGEFVKQATDQDGQLLFDKNGQPIPKDAARNKQGDYSKALSRVLLEEELALLFKQQREKGNPHASAELQATILGNGDRKSGLFWEQKPSLSGAKLLEMLGRCTFERKGGADGKGEYRAPKASFTAERHVWLTRLNNLRIVVDGVTRPLNEEERRIALPLPYDFDTDITYKRLRNALVKGTALPDNRFRFAGLSYPSERQQVENKAKNPEEEKLIKLPAWQKLRSTLGSIGLKTEWESMAGAAKGDNPEQLDQIARVLSVYKEGNEVERELRALNLPGGEKMIEALSEVSFDKFHALSLKALRKIVPHMEQGMRYDEAVAAIPEYSHHSQRNDPGTGTEKYLPPFYESHRGKEPHNRDKMLFSERIEQGIQGGIPRNPVVLRALNQARKVCNALIRRYGSPHTVHIEMARDLSRPLKERKEVSDAQKEFRERNERDKSSFAAEFGVSPKSREFERYQLYCEQQGKCSYSLEPLDLHRVLHDIGYAEVDHALPYKRSYDDSKNNKVLVLTKENRNKGEQTPYEYLDGASNSERWHNFAVWVESNKSYRQAKRSRLLRKDFGESSAREFRDRNLNDTRYICKFFKNYVERYLQLADESEAKRCVVVSGTLTSALRARWGLPTSKEKREESDRHHALDAAVIAACGHKVVQRLTTAVRDEGWAHRPEQGGYVNMETGEILSPKEFMKKDSIYKLFPKPWPHFRRELLARLSIDDTEKLRTEMQQFGTYPENELERLHPLFVSRAVQRRNGGAAHMDTIYTKPRDGHVLMVNEKEAKKTAKDNAEKVLRPATAEEKASMAISRIGVTGKDSKGNFKLTLEKLSDIVDPHRNARMIDALHQWIVNRDEREKAAKAIEASFGRGKEKRKPTEAETAELGRLRTLPRKPLKDDPDSGPFTGPIIRTVKVNAGKMSGIHIRNGLAAQESLVRVDVFTKEGKFYLAPLYVADKVKEKLPDQTADGETQINISFEFRFSLYPNDLTKITLKGKGSILGYFRGYGGPPNPYNITLSIHDRNKNGHERANEKGEIPSIGVKTALSVEKFNVDVLGNIYPALREKRRGLA